MHTGRTGCCARKGWTSLHQILATRPDHDLQAGPLKGAQSSYPFNRDYIYR
jgi:cyclopropane-fatty-acyl-phospholipid synthase